MSVKTILSFVSGAPGDTETLDAALGLAASMRALLRVVHVTPPPVVPDPVPVGIFAGLPYGDGDTVDRISRIEAELAAQAAAGANAACQRHTMKMVADGATIAMGQAQAMFREITGDFVHCVKREAATADLIVASYDRASDIDPVLSGLFDGRRAVLALPRDAEVRLAATSYARTVVIAWDGSPAAGRAVREAVPFLLHADTVYVVLVAHDGDAEDERSRADIVTYLRSHCVSANVIFTARNGRKIGEALLAEAARLKAGLLVMGAYGHSHMGEMILGGVSDHVLKHASLPLLLAH